MPLVARIKTADLDTGLDLPYFKEDMDFNTDK